MPATYNISTFRSVRRAHGVGLLAKCYTACVYLELCLKSSQQLIHHAGPSGHNLPQMLRQLPSVQGPRSKLLAAISLASQLENQLNKLYCADKKQQPAKVDGRNYPNMRYLRHESDWGGAPDTSSDGDLKKLLSLLDQIIVTLRPPNTNLPL